MPRRAFGAAVVAFAALDGGEQPTAALRPAQVAFATETDLTLHLPGLDRRIAQWLQCHAQPTWIVMGRSGGAEVEGREDRGCECARWPWPVAHSGGGVGRERGAPAHFTSWEHRVFRQRVRRHDIATMPARNVNARRLHEPERWC